jgi:hypothetical protein
MRHRGTQEPGVVDAMNVGALGATPMVAITMFVVLNLELRSREAVGWTNL